MRGVLPLTEQLPPSVQVTELMTIVECANAELGIADAATAREGVVVEFVTVGTNHVGHEPDGAENEVTDPEPDAQAPFAVVQTGLPKIDMGNEEAIAVLDRDSAVTPSVESTISSRPGSEATEPSDINCQFFAVVL